MKLTPRFWYILIPVVLALATLAFVARRNKWFESNKETEVTVAATQRSTIVEKVSASGKIQPVVEVKISPDVSGEIIDLAVAEGDSVVKNQLLCRIRPDNYKSLLDRAEAAVSQSRAAQAQSKAALAQTRARLERSRLDFERNKKLHEQKVISDSDFETVRQNYEVAKEELESAEANFEAARYSVESAQATLNDARENLRKTTILAPVSGIISKLNVQKGERVVGTAQMAGTELMRIANLQNMEVLIDVNENDVVKITLGDSAEVDVDSYSGANGRKFKGIVTSIANSAKTQATADVVTEFEVKVQLVNQSYADLVTAKQKYPFRPGMTASVEVITEKKENVLSVPISAVTTRASSDTAKKASSKKGETTSTPGKDKLVELVFLHKADGTVQRREVQTGISDFDHIEIKSGLQEGESIVTGPFLTLTKKLKDGDKVKVKKEKGFDAESRKKSGKGSGDEESSED